MMHVETDPESLVEIYQLTDDVRPTDNIYGEQPYSSPQGNRIAVRHYRTESMDGGLCILDLADGSLHSVLTEMPRFPAFHAWGEYLYYQEEAEDALVLKRCHYDTLVKEAAATLPAAEGRFSYGTVSPDHRFYAVSVHQENEPCRVLLFDLVEGSSRVLARNPTQYFKHEQFSRGGRNRLLIQANSVDRTVVNLGVMETDREGIDWLPVDAPPITPYGRWPGGERHTPRCTGHEAWVGETDRVFLSTGYDEARATNIWTAASAESSPTPVGKTPRKFGHVSVSRCGKLWLADAPGEEGVPIYVGSLDSDVCHRLVFSRTVHDGQQWSHTHPYLTADNRWLIFTSSRSGRAQVYGARISDQLLSRV